jgi:AraC-like DNA-binding protein
MATAIPWTPRGVVGGEAVRRDTPVGRYLPCPELAPFVQHFWPIAWDLEGRPPVVRETLPHPTVHLVVEPGRSGLAGPTTRRFVATLEGRGWVLGVKFHPGGFRPFWRGPVSELADRVVPLEVAFGPEGAAYEREVLDLAGDEKAQVACAEAFLLRRLPPVDPQVARVRELVAAIERDRSLIRVEDVADRAGLGVRALQRRFADYVGVSPKWVLARYRLHEAMARLEAGTAPDLATLAMELGYFDQAHFTRDFKALLGRSPGAYARGEGP